MSTATVMFQSPESIEKKIVFGGWVVLIMAISTAAGSFYYWSATTNILDATYMDKQDAVAKIILYSIMLVALSVELGKYTTQSIYHNSKLWKYAVVLSMLTSIGGTAILNHQNLNALKKDSDGYKTNVDALADAKKKRSEFAGCKDKTIAELDAEYSANESSPPKKDNGKTDWTQFHATRDRIAKDKECVRAYANANASVELAQADVDGTGNGSGGADDVSTNPLMKFFGKLVGQGEESATILFFIFTMLGIELMSFWISSERERLIREKELTATQLLAISVKETTGFDLINLQGNVINEQIQREFAQEAAQQDILLLRKAYSNKLKDRAKDYSKMSDTELKDAMRGVNTIELFF